MSTHPRLRQVVLDTTDVRRAAEYYRRLLDWTYRPGDEPPATDRPDAADWLVLVGAAGERIAFQQVASLTASTWPDDSVPQQAHLDLTVTTTDELDRAGRLAEELGGRLLSDRSTDPEEPLRVYADPDGHPLCIFVAPTEIGTSGT